MTHRPLCLLLLLVASCAGLAKSSNSETPPTLDITSSFVLGHPMLGDTLGPFPVSSNVTLLCSSKDIDLLLSWWEGEEQVPSLDANSREQGAGRSISLEALSVSDNGRRFKCKALGTDLEKTVSIEVENNDASDGALDVQVNGVALDKDQGSVEVREGDDLKLTCVMQGYDKPAPAWFYDGSEQESSLESSSQAASSVSSASSILVLQSVSLLDNGRHFTCRSEGGVEERMVEVLVYDREFIEETGNPLRILQVVLICISIGGVVMIFVMVVVVVRLAKDYKQAVGSQKVSKVSEIFKKYSKLSNVTGSSQVAFASQSSRGPYKPCTILIDPEACELDSSLNP